MADEKHLEIIEQGVKVWNEWRRSDMQVRPDLSGIDLSGRELKYANFMVTDLSGSNLSKANLEQAYMTHANLSNADMREANLSRADMRNANLLDADLFGANLFEGLFVRALLVRTAIRGCDMRESVLINAFMQEVDLTGSDLTGSDFTGAKYSGLKIEGASGLEKLKLE
jgi:uncharacterized protein YjbI with pentapeptide repeats